MQLSPLDFVTGRFSFRSWDTDSDTDTDPDTDPDPEPDTDPDTEPEPDPEPDPDTDTDTDSRQPRRFIGRQEWRRGISPSTKERCTHRATERRLCWAMCSTS